jgi:hypothetical protein
MVLIYVVVDRSPFVDFDERSVLSASTIIRRLEVAGVKYIPGRAYVAFVCATALPRMVIRACRLLGASFRVRTLAQVPVPCRTLVNCVGQYWFVV